MTRPCAWSARAKPTFTPAAFFSEQRAEYLDFVAPLARADTSIFSQKNIYGLDDVQNLQGFEVGVLRGDFAESYLRKQAPQVRLVPFNSNEALFHALAVNRIKVFICDTPTALYFLQKNHQLEDFNYNPGRPIYSNTYSAAVRKGAAALADLIKTGFSQIDPKQKQALENRWLNRTKPIAGNSLTIAAHRNFRPFTWLPPSGQPSGILVDLWRLWASKTGRKINFIFAATGPKP